MFLLLNPKIVLPFEAAKPHSPETFLSVLIVIHNSFSFAVLYFIFRFPCPVCRHLQFPKCNNNWHFSDQLTNLSRQFCKCCLAPSVLTFICILVSSTHFSMLLFIFSYKSLIHNQNNKGPNTDPFGALFVTDF